MNPCRTRSKPTIRRGLRALAIVLATATSIAAPSAIAAPGQAPKGFLGVNSSSPLDDADYAAMREANVGQLRTGFTFASLKSRKGDPYDWTRTDGILAGTATYGIDLIPVLYGVPPWVSTERSTTPIGRAETDWRKLLTDLVKRYGPEGEFWASNPTVPYRPIEVWQAWNEPNSRTWWQPRPDPKEYGKLLVQSARAIHAVDPQARIMTAGIVADPTNAAAIKGKRFLREMFESRSVRKATDVIAFHPYAPTTKEVERQLLGVRKTLRKSRMDKTPVSITEVGWGSEGGREHPLIMPRPRLEQELRKLLTAAVDGRRRFGLEGLLWYHWQDHPDDLCLWCESSGLVDENGVAKPLLDVFETIARL